MRDVIYALTLIVTRALQERRQWLTEKKQP
jgi:hypothetical protein